MIPQLLKGLVGMQRVVLFAIAMVPLVIFLLVISPGLMVKSFRAGGLTEAMTVMTGMASVMKTVLTGSMEKSSPPSQEPIPVTRRNRSTRNANHPRQ